jgi:hypothetical protein
LTAVRALQVAAAIAAALLAAAPAGATPTASAPAAGAVPIVPVSPASLGVASRTLRPGVVDRTIGKLEYVGGYEIADPRFHGVIGLRGQVARTSDGRFIRWRLPPTEPRTALQAVETTMDASVARAWGWTDLAAFPRPAPTLPQDATQVAWRPIGKDAWLVLWRPATRPGRTAISAWIDPGSGFELIPLAEMPLPFHALDATIAPHGRPVAITLMSQSRAAETTAYLKLVWYPPRPIW